FGRPSRACSDADDPRTKAIEIPADSRDSVVARHVGSPRSTPARGPPASREQEGVPMIAGVKYGHTNLVAQDWRSLARFYEHLFGCTPVPPERDFKGEDLERGTGIAGAELRGVHLRLPGHGADGPTLEIFNYNVLEERPSVAVNRPGFGHIAFVVDDVPSARRAVLAAGGPA